MPIHQPSVSLPAKEAFERLYDGNRLKKGTCQRVVSESAWWLSHPTGPVRSAGDSSNVFDGHHGWTIQYGSNSLCLERAINQILNALGALSNPISSESLQHLANIKHALSENVEDRHGNFIRYPTQKLIKREFLVFGSHGIEPRAAWAFLLGWLGHDQLADIVDRM